MARAHGTMDRVSTILIIDDDPRFRSQARDVLEADGFDVIGQAVDGASGLEAARRLRPDFVLLDIGLPDVGGFEVARTLAVDGPPPLVVLTSSRDARAYGRRLTTGDCLGFIPKEQLSGAAIRALVDRR
jgi:DNA-binding NarL/FixJ family response regulator